MVTGASLIYWCLNSEESSLNIQLWDITAAGISDKQTEPFTIRKSTVQLYVSLKDNN